MKATKKELLQFLQKEPELWIPISNIIRKFPGDEQEVISTLNSNKEFAKSTRANGEERFASRNQVRTEGKFVDKLIGAFKNRID